MIYNFIKTEFKFQFQNKLVLIGYSVGILVNLLVYYYSSKVFIPNVNLSGEFLEHGYFEYILLGEICLMISQVSLNEGQDAFFRYKESGVLEQFYFSKKGLVSNLSKLYISLITINFLHILISLFFAKVIFHASFNYFQIVRVLNVQIFSAFIFLGLYYLNLVFSALMGRRNGSIQHFVNVLTFFSGAYFPLSIIPFSFLREVLSLSPFTLIVSFSRTYIYLGQVKFDILLALVLWLLVSFIISFFLYFIFLKKKGIGRYVSPQ